MDLSIMITFLLNISRNLWQFVAITRTMAAFSGGVHKEASPKIF